MSRIDKEHILQGHLVRWVREAVPGAEFFAFDRSAAYGQWSHARQKARGVRKGTPDTVLCLVDSPPIWCELKAPGEKPDEDQEKIGERLCTIGHHWFWATSIQQYHEELARYGVPMVGNAAFLALHHDGLVDSVIARAEMKTGRSPRQRTAKPTISQVRRAAANGFWRP